MRKPKILLVIFFSLVLFSCKTPVSVNGNHLENTTTEQTSSASKERDSIFVYIEKEVYRDGDTVYVYKNKTEYKDRWFTRVDTFFRDVQVLDTIMVDVPVEKVVKTVPKWVPGLVALTLFVLFGNVILLIIKVKRKLGK